MWERRQLIQWQSLRVAWRSWHYIHILPPYCPLCVVIFGLFSSAFVNLCIFQSNKQINDFYVSQLDCQIIHHSTKHNVLVPFCKSRLLKMVTSVYTTFLTARTSRRGTHIHILMYLFLVGNSRASEERPLSNILYLI